MSKEESFKKGVATWKKVNKLLEGYNFIVSANHKDDLANCFTAGAGSLAYIMMELYTPLLQIYCNEKPPLFIEEAVAELTEEQIFIIKKGFFIKIIDIFIESGYITPKFKISPELIK